MYNITVSEIAVWQLWQIPDARAIKDLGKHLALWYGARCSQDMGMNEKEMFKFDFSHNSFFSRKSKFSCKIIYFKLIQSFVNLIS